jgi:excisionase family DNA binding protein
MIQQGEREYISMQQAMQMYKKSRTTFYRWIQEGLKSHRVGGTRMFKYSEIEEWVRANAERLDVYLPDVDNGFKVGEEVITPKGPGTFMEYVSTKSGMKVAVEMDHMYQMLCNLSEVKKKG